MSVYSQLEFGDTNSTCLFIGLIHLFADLSEPKDRSPPSLGPFATPIELAAPPATLHCCRSDGKFYRESSNLFTRQKLFSY